MKRSSNVPGNNRPKVYPKVYSILFTTIATTQHTCWSVKKNKEKQNKRNKTKQTQNKIKHIHGHWTFC